MEMIDLRIQDSTATSGSCADWFYVYDGQTKTYQQWCASSDWTQVSPLYIDSWSINGGGSAQGTRTIDVAFATPSTTTGAALWMSIYGQYLWYLGVASAGVDSTVRLLFIFLWLFAGGLRHIIAKK
jgi:hypothetical protein